MSVSTNNVLLNTACISKSDINEFLFLSFLESAFESGPSGNITGATVSHPSAESYHVHHAGSQPSEPESGSESGSGDEQHPGQGGEFINIHEYESLIFHFFNHS